MRINDDDGDYLFMWAFPSWLLEPSLVAMTRNAALITPSNLAFQGLRHVSHIMRSVGQALDAAALVIRTSCRPGRHAKSSTGRDILALPEDYLRCADRLVVVGFSSRRTRNFWDRSYHSAFPMPGHDGGR